MHKLMIAGAVALACVSTSTVVAKGIAPVNPPAPASATYTITYTGIPYGTLSSYTEGDYVMNLVSGTFTTTTYGAGGPKAIGVLGPLAADYDPGAPANVFALSRTDGGLFTIDNFQSVRASAAGTNTITLQGYNGGVLSDTSTLTSQYDGYFQPISSGLMRSYDQVLFTLGTTSSGATLDQVVVTSTPSVPEPATWAMMLSGFGAIGYGMRRRRAAVSFG